MEKKYYKSIEITYIDEEERGYIYKLSDEELAEIKEFYDVKNKACSLSEETQNVSCFVEGYFDAKKKIDLKEGVKIWQAIFKHEKQKFDYKSAMEYAKKGWEYYFELRGNK